MSVVIVYRSESARPACERVVRCEPSHIRSVQESSYRHLEGDTAVIRWDSHTELRIPTGVMDVNPLLQIGVARNKALSRVRLGTLAPLTWQTRHAMQFPAVIRPRRHKAGERFFVVNEMDAARRAINRCGAGWYASQLLNKSREFRVFVVQNRVIAVSERFPGEDVSAVAWNLALGGRLANLERKQWPLPVLTASLEAMRRIGLGWGAVDACLDTDGRAWVFEMNTAPALRNHYTIEQIAKAFAWIDSEDPETYALTNDGTLTWKDYIHPALRA